MLAQMTNITRDVARTSETLGLPRTNECAQSLLFLLEALSSEPEDEEVLAVAREFLLLSQAVREETSSKSAFPEWQESQPN